MKKLLIMDGQGGGMGKALIERIGKIENVEVVAVGLNALATMAMLRAGADIGVTGENAAKFNCLDADVIAGPIALVLANSLHGEISPEVAAAVSGCAAKKILIPSKQCNTLIAGTGQVALSQALDEAVEAIRSTLS